MSQKYPFLFSPIKIRGHKLKNRILTAPIGASFFGPSSHLTDYCIEFFEAKARGGAATVTQGDTPVTTGEYENTMSMAKYNLREREGFAMLSEFAAAMKQHGALASVQLNHNGAGQGTPFGVVESPGMRGGTVRAATTAEVERTIELYRECARGLRRAGFEMIQVHCGHNWFPHQFLRKTNTRTDRYGGSLENRMRMPQEVLRAVRGEIGEDAILEIRVSGLYPETQAEEFEELVTFLKSVEDVIDIVNVSSGGLMLPESQYGYSFPFYLDPQGVNVKKTAALKARIKTPVACLGNITDPDFAEQVLSEGKADFIALGRAMIADPEWPNKARRAQPEEIRPCLQCYKCLDYMHKYDAFACEVNPTLGREHRLKDLRPAERKKKLVIVGGGPAGMQAAVTAFDRGHSVVLFEKEEALGGLLRMFDNVPCKGRIRAFKEWLVRQVEKRGIDVRLGVEATPELIAAESPDAVFAATGSTAKIPAIPGVDGPNVITAAEANFDLERCGKHVAVIGGNMSGCDTAAALLGTGRSVTIVTGGLHREMNFMISGGMDRALGGAVIYKNSRCLEIGERGVLVHPMEKPASGGAPPMGPGRGGREEKPLDHDVFVEADTVVLAVGQVENDALSDEIRFIAPEFAEIGDCLKPGSIGTCVQNGFFAALDL